MSLFDDLSKKISKVGQGAAAQTKIFAETAKLSAKVSDEEKQINNLYLQIGKSYFEANCENPSATYADLMISIKDAQARIAQYKEQINSIKGVRKCPSCGAEVANGSAFCNACGTKMPDDFSAPVSAPTVKCPQCGSDIIEGTAFCNICGCNLSQQPAAPVAADIPTPVNVPTSVNIQKTDDNNNQQF